MPQSRISSPSALARPLAGLLFAAALGCIPYGGTLCWECAEGDEACKKMACPDDTATGTSTETETSTTTSSTSSTSSTTTTTTTSTTEAATTTTTTTGPACSNDLICDEGEDLEICLHDCGECEADGICAGGTETPYSCPEDCAVADCNNDGIVDALTEQCDDGNQEPADACTNTCEINICGDGLLYPVDLGGSEECDDGDLDDNDGCSSTCTIEHRLVFVSSILFSGDMGPPVEELTGLELADAHCQELAESASKEGTYKAWLSDGLNNPESRFGFAFSGFSGVFELVDGSVIATSWEDLTDGEITHTIDIDETGKEMQFSLIWTNTADWGGLAGAGSCINWTSTDAIKKGLAGANQFTDGQWTEFEPNSCANSARLYCFQVE